MIKLWKSFAQNYKTFSQAFVYLHHHQTFWERKLCCSSISQFWNISRYKVVIMIINHMVLSAAQNNNKDKLGNLLLITAQSDCFIEKLWIYCNILWFSKLIILCFSEVVINYVWVTPWQPQCDPWSMIHQLWVRTSHLFQLLWQLSQDRLLVEELALVESWEFCHHNVDCGDISIIQNHIKCCWFICSASIFP